MDSEEIKELFEGKYEKAIGVKFEQWKESMPQNEEQAYARCIEIDRELNASYDDWFNAPDDKRDELQETRDRLKNEYDFIEEIYHLEANDRNW